jgi:hypothetical protein
MLDRDLTEFPANVRRRAAQEKRRCPCARRLVAAIASYQMARREPIAANSQAIQMAGAKKRPKGIRVLPVIRCPRRAPISTAVRCPR